MRSKKGRPHVRRKTQGRQRSKYDAILGRTYGSRHLLSLERTGYYIQGKPKSQASNIVFSSDFPPAMPQSGEPKSSPIAKLLRSQRTAHRKRRTRQTSATGRARQSADRWRGVSGGSVSSPRKLYQTNLLVFILTPGPMVAAATQDLIYWPLAAAGLALTMAPMRAL